jgi:hypothetical protein
MAGAMPGKSTISRNSTVMIKLIPDRQLIHAGSGCVATKAAGVTKALTKGSSLWYRKHPLTFREKWVSGGSIFPYRWKASLELSKELGAEKRGLWSISTQAHSRPIVLFAPVFIRRKKPSPSHSQSP